VVHGLAVKEGRTGVVNGRVQTKDLALLYQPSRFQYPVFGQKIDAAYLVIVAKNAPVRLRRSAGLNRQLRELRDFCEIDFRHDERLPDQQTAFPGINVSDFLAERTPWQRHNCQGYG